MIHILGFVLALEWKLHFTPTNHRGDKNHLDTLWLVHKCIHAMTFSVVMNEA